MSTQTTHCTPRVQKYRIQVAGARCLIEVQRGIKRNNSRQSLLAFLAFFGWCVSELGFIRWNELDIGFIGFDALEQGLL